VDSIAERFRTRLLPALLLATGVALLGGGLIPYTTAVEPGPAALELPSFQPFPAITSYLTLPAAGATSAGPSFPPDRVATRVVFPRLGIDLAIVRQPNQNDYPLCDVAMYYPDLGQPGSGRATYIYAHAQPKMFLPILTASRVNDGAKMIGATVEIYTSDDMLFLYRVSEVRRHVHSIADAFADDVGRLWLQASEGPHNDDPKVQVIADFVSMTPADPSAAHPPVHARECHII
jgi:hypothetical protein